MKTTLYDYQEKTANDIYNRMAKGEIRGAYIAYQTRRWKNSYFSSCGR